jgi:transcriptional regulator with XRE-family HTH domain
MIERQFPFGVLLRRWRERRRMTQMDLAEAANSSTRHLSCLETGQAQPSREMVLRLSACLEIPLRGQNALLQAAGFAAAFQERSLVELAAARRAIEQILEAHKPYPAFAVNRHWDVVLSNRALPELYAGVSSELLQPPVNAIRLMLHPAGLAPRIINFSDWRAYIVSVLRQQADTSADQGIEGLLAEIQAYPAPGHGPAADLNKGSQRFATPLQISTAAGRVSFLNTVTVFGTPTDVTLSELALEMLFPADPETVATVKRLMG